MVSFNGGTDVFIIGGGPAGLAAAIAARQRGMSVTVADGTEPPIDKACGEGLMPESLAALAGLGVEIRPEAGCRFFGIRFLQNDARVSGEFAQGPGLGIRRPILHEWLIARAEACGVRLLWRTPVAGISPQGVHLPDGFVASRWIVGADGSGSRVRRWSGLDRAVREKLRYATRRHYHVRPWSQYVEIYWSKHGQAYVTPISQEEVCIVVMAAQVEHAEFDAFLNHCPELRAHLACAEVSTRERGAVTLMHSLFSVYRGNTALIGDASGGVDAITGEGLRLAFSQANALAASMESGDLRSYARAHRSLASKPTLMGELLLAMSRSERLQTRAIDLLANQPRLFARMLALHTGDAPWREMLFAGAQFSWRFLTA